MSPVAVLFLALAMSTDAFAVAIGKGCALDRPRVSEALRTGVIFGVIEAATPLVGWGAGRAAAAYVGAWSPWMAFAVLGLLGARMVAAAATSEEEDDPARPSRHPVWILAITGLATSLDALAVGAGLAFVDVAIVPIALAIGCATFVMVTIGVMVGRAIGRVAGRWAEALGGVLLIVIGCAILYQGMAAG